MTNIWKQLTFLVTSETTMKSKLGETANFSSGNSLGFSTGESNFIVCKYVFGIKRNIWKKIET